MSPRSPVFGGSGPNVAAGARAGNGRAGFGRRVLRALGGCRLLCAVPLVCGLSGPAVAGAQTVAGTAVSALDGTPLVGAVVELRDSLGARRTAVLTRSDGTFVARAPAPGTYSIAVGTMGYQTVTTEPFLLLADAMIHRRLELPLEPVRLEGIHATRDRRCRRPEGGPDLARVWEHARRGLLAVRITEETSRRRFHIRRREASQDTRRREVIEDTIWTFVARGRNPFRTESADVLLGEGFVHIRADTILYHAPDARLVLSDDFLDAYCFRLVRGPADSALVGLAFRPVERSRDRSTIEGTLWLDESTAELRRLEFEYLDPPLGYRITRPRGQLGFRRLDDGTWIVGQWWIHFDRPGLRRGGRLSRRSAGVHTSSGRVVEVLPDDP